MKRNLILSMLIIISLAVSACGKKGELEPPDKSDEQALLTTVIDEFFADYGITNLTTYWDNSGVLPGQLEVIGLPLTILIDENGAWIGRMDGPAEWNGPDALALMKAASEKPD